MQVDDEERDRLRIFRNDEIERKRQRLAELRRQRQQRQQRRHLSPPKIFGNHVRSQSPETEAAHLLSEVDKMLTRFGFADAQSEPSSQVSTRKSASVAVCSIQTETVDLEDTANVCFSPEPVITYDKTVQTEVADYPLAPTNEEKHFEIPIEKSENCDREEDAISQTHPSDTKQVHESVELTKFIARASLYVERALANPFDIMVDYAQSTEDEVATAKELILQTKLMFSISSLTDNRPITSLDWSTKHPELIMASYGISSNEDLSKHNHAGTILIWSSQMPSRPEYQFECSSLVLCARFHPSYPHLIVGSTYSGQIVLWDQRSGSQSLSSTSLAQGHINPVFELVSSPLQSFISVSNDGKVCIWSDKVFLTPTMEKELSGDFAQEVSPVCIGFSTRDPGLLYFGSRSGHIYRMNIQAADLTAASINTSFMAHMAPITAISFHPLRRDTDKRIGDLFLTSSFDWTAKLWSVKTDSPLLSFPADDIVYDIQWSPNNTYVFALVDGNGYLAIWNLASNHFAPVLQHRFTDTIPCTRLIWSKDGKKIAVGDANGNIYVSDIPNSILDVESYRIIQFSKVLQKELTKEKKL
uniref:Uncharacterized protein n=1 Tax=Spongospora subterranea TaxID=70186 RepID=A0A0H5R9U0_9EUKA|eukprot:CRZ10447.1 hypothetical protein [Spongospora subterranea]